MPMYDYICEVCKYPGRAWRENGKPPRFCSNACKNIGMQGQPTKKGTWQITSAMHNRIREGYVNGTGQGEVKALATELGIPRWKITRYAQTQGWVARQKKAPYWSEEEVRQLQVFARYSPAVIQRKMREKGHHRSINAIVLKLRRLNMRQNIHGHSARDVARCFGVDIKTITRAINLGYLKATRRGTARTEQQGGDMYYILDEYIRQYVFDYLSEIDLRKVDKYWFVDLIAPEDRR